MLGRSQCHTGSAYRGDLFAAKRSHSHVHGGLTGGCAPTRGAERRINMAFRKTSNGVEYDQAAETEVEAEIREFVRRDVVTNRERQPENESEIAAAASTPCCSGQLRPRCRRSTSSSRSCRP